MLLQKMWLHWEFEDASADFPFSLPVGVPCGGSFHGWSASPVNFLLGIWCMQEGKSPVIAVSLAVFVFALLGICCFPRKKIAGELCERFLRENRKAVRYRRSFALWVFFKNDC